MDLHPIVFAAAMKEAAEKMLADALNPKWDHDEARTENGVTFLYKNGKFVGTLI